MRFLPLLVVLIAVVAAACGDAEEEELTDGGNSATTTAAVTPTTPVATATPAGPTTPNETDTPTPVPSPATPDGWQPYEDAGFNFAVSLPRKYAVHEQTFELTARGPYPPVSATTLVFRDSAETVMLSISIAPNPAALTLDEWVRAYTGFSEKPDMVTVDRAEALVFAVDPTGAANPTVYVAHGASVYGLRGNLAAAGAAPAGMSGAEFSILLGTFRFIEA